MDESTPAPLRNAAIVQLVSGLIDFFVMGWLAWFVIGCFCGVLTLPLGSVGGFCGLLSFLLVPLGLLEMGAGIYGLMNPREGASAMRLVSWLEIAGLFVGGIPGAIAGGCVQMLLSGDDVVAFLDG